MLSHSRFYIIAFPLQLTARIAPCGETGWSSSCQAGSLLQCWGNKWEVEWSQGMREDRSRVWSRGKQSLPSNAQGVDDVLSDREGHITWNLHFPFPLPSPLRSQTLVMISSTLSWTNYVARSLYLRCNLTEPKIIKLWDFQAECRQSGSGDWFRAMELIIWHRFVFVSVPKSVVNKKLSADDCPLTHLERVVGLNQVPSSSDPHFKSSFTMLEMHAYAESQPKNCASVNSYFRLQNRSK